jgi:hypothetical protein
MYVCPQRRKKIPKVSSSPSDYFPHEENSEQHLPTELAPWYISILHLLSLSLALAPLLNSFLHSSYLSPGIISLVFSSLSFKYSYTVKVTACPGATRITRGVIPIQNALMPSAFHI